MGISKKPLIIGVVAATIIIAVIAVYVVTRGDAPSENTAAENTSSSAATDEDSFVEQKQKNHEYHEYIEKLKKDPNYNFPGALIGNTQRTWPDKSGRIDDSGHKTPGQYSPDMFQQRPVWTPINHDGDLPKKSGLKDGFEGCKTPDKITLEGKTQQQYVNARYLVVNEQAGPTKMERGVPRGYAHSPQGAILATINMTYYGRPQEDEIGVELTKTLWKSSAKAQEDLFEDEAFMANYRPKILPSPNGFKVVQCSENIIVVETICYAQDMQLITRIPMVWKDGDWQANLSGAADNQAYQESKYSGLKKEDFAEISYS